MSEYVPTTEQVNAFKAAWHDADDDGQAGKRVEIALAKVLGPALAAARREGQAEALRQAAYEFAEGAWQDQWSADAVECDVTAVQSTYRWFVAKADQIENGADQ